MSNQNNLSNYEIITLAIYLLGGESNYLDVEDIAVKCFEIAPDRFCWKKYPQFINLESVRRPLSGKHEESKDYILGTVKKGWFLNQNGVSFAKNLLDKQNFNQDHKKNHTFKEKQWLRSEKTRLLASEAFQKSQNNENEKITQQEIESFFRIDEYVIGEARERKIARIINNFGDDEILGDIVTALASKVKKG